MTDDVCPKCGAAHLKSMSTTTGLRKLYACYTVFENGVLVEKRNRSCYRGEIVALKAGMRDAVEVMRKIVNPEQASGDSCNLIPMKSISKAAALLPTLERLAREG